MIKKIQAVILTVILALSAVAVTAQPAFAKEKTPFTLEVKSNFFPSKTVSYTDVNRYADQNGDIYLTVDFNIFAKDLQLINFQVNHLTWDPNVLEYDVEKNSVMYLRRKVLNLHPLLTEQGFGAAVVTNTARVSEGKLLCNFSNVSEINQVTAYSLDDNENPVPGTFTRLIFKVIDPSAAKTTVTFNPSVLSFDDEGAEQPNYKYWLETGCSDDDIRTNITDLNMLGLSTVITPEGDTAAPAFIKGDVNGDGEVDVADATSVQLIAAELLNPTEIQKLAADVNGDGKADVNDVTLIQLFAAELIASFG